MKKNTVSIQELANRSAQIQTRMLEIADAAEARENKEMTKEEKTEREALQNELLVLRTRMLAAGNNGGQVTVSSRETAFDEFIREAYKHPGQEYKLSREFAGNTTTGNVGIVPLTILDIQKPLEDGLILSKIGIPLQTGLAGDYCWPFVGKVEASIAGEAVELADKKITMSKLSPKPVRIGITIPVTNQAINQTSGVIFNIIKLQMPAAVARLINRAMFCTEKYNADFHGPLSDAKSAGTFAGAVPTYAELVKMKGAILKTGVESDGTLCYVMSEAMKAQLEATPIDAGSGRMVVENGKIAGVPVFCTNYINYDADGEATAVENIGLGVWSYEPVGQFGDMRFIVDPYTGAKSDVVNLTLNMDFSMTTLRKEAFAWMKCKAQA